MLCLLSCHPFYRLRHKWALISRYLLCARWTKQKANKKTAFYFSLIFSVLFLPSLKGLIHKFTTLCILRPVKWFTLISPPLISYSPIYLNNTCGLYYLSDLNFPIVSQLFCFSQRVNIAQMVNKGSLESGCVILIHLLVRAVIISFIQKRFIIMKSFSTTTAFFLF